MGEKTAIVVTSIASPNEALKALAAGCGDKDCQFIVIGDKKSPTDFSSKGCDFYSLERQIQTNLKFAQNCPTNHYARKNIGYLLAVKNGASVIIETDDDNIPLENFWQKRQLNQNVPVIENSGWVNTYRYFTDANIWPRGFALEHLADTTPAFDSLQTRQINCPVQQGLCNDNPDVDAIYRLMLSLPIKFINNQPVALGPGCWCPFNSQNTTWFAEAFEMLYLPAYCSFRMTDIWRSLIAQKICHLNGWAVLFTKATMSQRRNVHNLLKDFEEEIPGYLNNGKICRAVENLPLNAGRENIADNMRIYYEKLVEMSLIKRRELELIEDWFSDIRQIEQSS